MMKLSQKFILISLAILSLSAVAGYWYVFIAGAPQIDAPKPVINTGLNFQVKTFNSIAMGETRSYGLILPPGYDQDSEKNRRYPVIFLLHGGHGRVNDYDKKARITAILQKLYQQGKLPPAIIITPDGNDKRGTSPFWDSEYFDGPNGKVATLIGAELVKEIKSQYRTLNNPQFWAIGGLSSGGWGAFNIGLRYLNNFNIFFSHTGYFTHPTGAANSPKIFIQDLPASDRQRLRIYLDAGEGDNKYLDATREFHKILDRIGIANEFRVFPGGHGIAGENVGWNYWHKHLSDSLTYVGNQFKNAEKSQY